MFSRALKWRRTTGALAVAGVCALGASGLAIADNLKSDLEASVGGDTATKNLGTVAGGSAQSVPVQLYVQDNNADTPDYPLTISVDTAVDGANNSVSGVGFSGVTLTAPGKATTASGIASQTGSLTFNAAAAQATQQSHTLKVRFKATDAQGDVLSGNVADELNANASEITLTYTVNGAPTLAAPTVTGSINPASPDGLDGWYVGSPQISWAFGGGAYDSLSADCSPNPRTVTADTAGTTLTCTATNATGSGSDSVTYKRDATAPTSVVTGFNSGQQITLGGTAPTPGCDADDATSGVASDGTPSVDSSGLTGNGVGSVSVTCNGATDNAGNTQTTASAAKNYSVVYGRDAGIGQPINADGTSVFSQKRAVPVKFALAGDQPNGFDVSSWQLRREGQPCDTENWVDEGSASTTASTTGLRYDAGADQYIANATLGGTTVGKCYRFVVALDDGTQIESPKFKVGK